MMPESNQREQQYLAQAPIPDNKQYLAQVRLRYLFQVAVPDPSTYPRWQYLAQVPIPDGSTWPRHLSQITRVPGPCTYPRWQYLAHVPMSDIAIPGPGTHARWQYLVQTQPQGDYTLQALSSQNKHTVTFVKNQF